ncbi:MAG: hypothetical protein KJN75_03625, partial [Muriicola sp.]|nr:hypothetical protein [Muriicola sp.]
NGNSSATVFEFNKATGAAWYSGLFQIFPSDIDLSSSQSFTFKIWSPKAGINVRMQLEKEGGGGGPTVFVDQTLATANTWVELTYDFSGVVNTSDSYDKFVVFPEFDDVGQPAGDGSVYYLDDFDQAAGGGGGGTEPSLPLGFENGETLIAFDGGAFATNVSNPDSNGNTSANVLQFNKVVGSAWYSGVVFDETLRTTPIIDLANGTVFTIKIWSPNAGIDVRFQLEGGAAPAYEVFQTVATANEWVTLTFDFTSQVNATDTYPRFSIFPDFDASNQVDVTVESIYYIDDIIQQ